MEFLDFPDSMQFHPSDAQLLDYLKGRISEHLQDSPNSMSDIIPDIDLYGQGPWDLPSYFENSMAQGSNRDAWYFFCPRREKYQDSGRLDRTVSGVGVWKHIGKMKQILCESTSTEMGTRSSLVFHTSTSSGYNRTDWVIHEYNLNPSSSLENVKEMPFVACCLMKKKLA